MAKVRAHLIESKTRYKITDDFYDIIANLKTKKDIINFFMGLFTPGESVMMARRIQVAKALLEEKGYEQIRKELRVSYQTITKTDHWLHSRGDEYGVWISACISGKKIENKIGRSYAGRISSLDKYAHHRAFKKIFS